MRLFRLSFSSGENLLNSGAITAGSTWNFQLWYRDPAAGGAGSNLSNGLQVVFACPLGNVPRHIIMANHSLTHSLDTYLLEHGPDDHTATGRTQLHAIVKVGNTEVVQGMFKRGLRL